jgi:N-acetylglucosamine-6-phosphate deacetylase
MDTMGSMDQTDGLTGGSRPAALLIRDVRIVAPGLGIETGDLLVQDGRIAACGAVDPAAAAGAQVVAGGGRLLTPGLIDIHTHGLLEHAYEDGPDACRAIAAALPRFGVTTVLPTIVPRLEEGWHGKFRVIAAALPAIRSVCIPGLHLEGPFVAIPGAACATVAADLGLLDQLLDACHGRVAAMSVSPEVDGIVPIIGALRRRGIAAFLTHTRAGVDETLRALDAGASHATHFYDVFYPPAETDPGVRPVGIVETMLADPRASVDFIADGVHVHPMAIRLAVAARGYANVILITDSNIGAGLPPGLYPTPWGFPLRVEAGGGARHATEGFLAGSALTMDRGIANLLAWLDLPPEQVWAMGTRNPADRLGLTGKGRIEPGADADLVLWDDTLRPLRTWVAGRCVYAAAAIDEPDRSDG